MPLVSDLGQYPQATCFLRHGITYVGYTPLSSSTPRITSFTTECAPDIAHFEKQMRRCSGGPELKEV